jgi:CspA family cold shock protein
MTEAAQFLEDWRQSYICAEPRTPEEAEATVRETVVRRSTMIFLEAVSWYGPGTIMEVAMAKGTVKWFNPTKGYGFIQPMGGGKDVFVHISAVERAGLNTLNEGQTVEYEEVANKGKTSAENLKVAR